MAEWFEVKVRFLRQLDNGLIKQVAEQYLIDSLSFTEAEGRVMLEVSEGMREVTVQKIARSNIKEVVFYGDTEMWFKCKVQYSTLDEETEKEKKVTTYLLVNANDAKEAFERTELHLKDMLVPFSIPDIKETKIVEVYQHVSGLRPGLRRMEKQQETEVYQMGKKDTPREPIGFKVPSPIIPPMLDTGCEMHTKSAETDYSARLQSLPEKLQNAYTNPTDGKPHEFEIPDGWWDAETFLDSLETPVYVRVSDQHTALPQAEFKTWVMAAHRLTESQALTLGEFMSKV